MLFLILILVFQAKLLASCECNERETKALKDEVKVTQVVFVRALLIVWLCSVSLAEQEKKLNKNTVMCFSTRKTYFVPVYC